MKRINRKFFFNRRYTLELVLITSIRTRGSIKGLPGLNDYTKAIFKGLLIIDPV